MLRALFTLSLTVVLTATAPLRASEPAVAVKPAAAKTHAAHFIDPAAIDSRHILPAPPEAGSLSARADLEAVLQVQATRTPDQVEWAQRIAENDPFLSAQVIGPWFAAQNLPKTAALLKDVDDDRKGVTELAKNLFARPRPWVVDPHVQPCIAKPANDSYPSGHATSIFARAEILAALFPDQRTALFEFAHRSAWGRVSAGVHFPSDLIGGMILAEPIAAAITRSPAFQARLQEVRAEIAAFRATLRR